MRGNEGDIVFSQVGSEANSTILRYMVAMATPCKVSAFTYNCLLASALDGQTVDTRLFLSPPTPPRTWARDCLHTIWWSYLKGVLLVLPFFTNQLTAHNYTKCSLSQNPSWHFFQWLLSWLLHREGYLLPTWVRKITLPTFQLNAPVVIRAAPSSPLQYRKATICWHMGRVWNTVCTSSAG